ncbi:MAG TPA: ERV1/ALR-related protein, partial [Tepidisphaeraceae bacterium]|nr:ERV1/ALR-related protein [Tepidisphaeraceae bacterium]
MRKANPPQRPPQQDPPANGPQLWADLHQWALTTDLSDVVQWLARFAARVPCGECRRHWLAAVANSPPLLESREKLFAWTVDLHNVVNRRLGKPPMSLADARRRWQQFPLQLPDESPQWRKNRKPRAPVPPDPPPAPADVSQLFDTVWCINLDDDSKRWDAINRQIAESDWPFRHLTRFAAILGDTVGVPDYFHQGGGAWGCLVSHRRVLELSLMAGHQRILVIEDDADIRPDFGQRIRQFLADLGDEPWDALMLGGQHISTPSMIRPGVVRCINTQRTHCMAFSRVFMRELYRHWSAPLDQHCDWSLGPFAGRWRTYAPERFIVGQRGGKSRITGGQKPPEWWNPPPPDAPVVWLRCPRDTIEACRDIFHAGNRRNEAGVCIGLADVFNPLKNPSEGQQIAAMRSWISMIQWEVESRGDGSVCTIWNPAAREQIVRAATDRNLMIIDAQTAYDARNAWRACRNAPSGS